MTALPRLLRRHPGAVRWAVALPVLARLAATATVDAVRDLDDALVPLDDDDTDAATPMSPALHPCAA